MQIEISTKQVYRRLKGISELWLVYKESTIVLKGYPLYTAY